MGVPAAGMVLLPLNTRLAAPELISIVQAARPKVLVTDRDPGPLADVVARVVTFEEWDVLLDHASAPSRAPEVSEDDLALLYFTGGTTGRPKGVMLTHRNLVANSFHKTLACRFEPDDVYLAVAPFFHVAGTAASRRAALDGRFVRDPPGVRPGDEPRRDRTAPRVGRDPRADDGRRAGSRAVGPAAQGLVAPAPRSCRFADHDRPVAPSARHVPRLPSSRSSTGPPRPSSIVTCMPHEERHLEGGRLGSVGQPAVGVEVARDRRRRRALCPPGVAGEVIVRGPERDGGLLGGRGGDRGGVRRRLVPHRATSALSTTSTTSPCSTEPRT